MCVHVAVVCFAMWYAMLVMLWHAANPQSKNELWHSYPCPRRRAIMLTTCCTQLYDCIMQTVLGMGMGMSITARGSVFSSCLPDSHFFDMWDDFPLNGMRSPPGVPQRGGSRCFIHMCFANGQHLPNRGSTKVKKQLISKQHPK